MAKTAAVNREGSTRKHRFLIWTTGNRSPWDSSSCHEVGAKALVSRWPLPPADVPTLLPSSHNPQAWAGQFLRLKWRGRGYRGKNGHSVLDLWILLSSQCPGFRSEALGGAPFGSISTAKCLLGIRPLTTTLPPQKGKQEFVSTRNCFR